MEKRTKNQNRKSAQKKAATTDLAETKRNKLSRRKKAKARDTLRKAFASVVSEIDNDAFLRNHLFLEKADENKLIVGGYIIVKKDNGWFDIYKKNLSNLEYKDVFIFDAAMAIVESLNAGHGERVKEGFTDHD